MVIQKAGIMVELIHDDCMNVMSKYKDKHFELAICDPPYGIGIHNKKMGYSIASTIIDSTKWDIIPDKKYFEELFRVSINQVIWGGNFFGLPANSGFIIWDKKNEGRDFSEIEYAWTNMKVIPRKFTFGVLNSNPKRDKVKIHKCQKPIALYAWLLKNYAKPGDKILDTHGGSGSSAIAAHKLGFDMTWIEIDKDYFDAAMKRFKKETAMPLFDNV